MAQAESLALGEKLLAASASRVEGIEKPATE
jgi:hypothetical protein